MANENTTTIRIYKDDKPAFDKLLARLTVKRGGHRTTQADLVKAMIEALNETKGE